MTSANPKKILIAVVNFNAPELTRECVHSICRYPASDYETDIAVFDNSARPDSLDQLQMELFTLGYELGNPTARATIMLRHEKPEYPDIHLLTEHRNIGFAAACNRAIQFGQEQAASFFFLLNNDATVEYDTLRLLAQTLEQQPNLGVVSPCIQDSEAPLRMQSRYGVELSLKTFRGFSLLSETDYELALKRQELAESIIYPPGAAMMIRNDVIAKIGLLSERYFLYYEEADYVMRMCDYYRVGFVPEARVSHSVGASIGSGHVNRAPSPISVFFMSRSRLRFAAKFRPLCVAVPYFLLWFQAIRFFVRLEWPQARALLQVLSFRFQPKREWFGASGSSELPK